MHVRTRLLLLSVPTLNGNTAGFHESLFQPHGFCSSRFCKMSVCERRVLSIMYRVKRESSEVDFFACRYHSMAYLGCRYSSLVSLPLFPLASSSVDKAPPGFLTVQLGTRTIPLRHWAYPNASGHQTSCVPLHPLPDLCACPGILPERRTVRFHLALLTQGSCRSRQ